MKMRVLNAETDTSGYFYFPFFEIIKDPNSASHFSIPLVSNDDLMRGVSTADLIKIQKHILDIELLTEPWQHIAADVDNSKSITTRDLIHLKKAILGLSDSFPNNTSWRFTASNFSFRNSDPFEASLQRSMRRLECPEEDLFSIKAIKVGDVDGDHLEE